MTDAAPAVFVIGPAGSGKSTIARALATQLPGCYLDKDTLTEPFVRHALVASGRDPDAREHDDHYRSAVMPLEYRVLFDTARDNLLLGQAVVIDAPFSAYLGDPDYLARTRVAHGWPAATAVTVVAVSVQQETLFTRLAQRNLPRDQWKLTHRDEFMRRFAVVSCRWSGATVVDIANGELPPDVSAVIDVISSG